MVMEFVEGDTLQTLYEKLYQNGERMTYGDAFRYMLEMCEGVRAAHKLDIVHRDLKPDNVMLTPDGDGGTKVMILDFGIAKLKASGEVDQRSHAPRRGDGDAGVTWLPSRRSRPTRSTSGRTSSRSA